MAGNLQGVIDAIWADPGIRANNPRSEIRKGVEGCKDINASFMEMLQLTKANADGQLTPGDMNRLSRMKQDRPDLFIKFDYGHGKDSGEFVCGFHHVRGDGGTLMFQGQAFIDTIADTINSVGYRIYDGQYYNHDGPTGKSPRDAAGWVNYFVNGVNAVYGTGRNDELGSGEYSGYFAKARSETFLAGDGDDRIWAIEGNDRVYGGDGRDLSGGGRGNDRMYGEDGRDTLWGDEGRGRIYGGPGDDELGGGKQADRMFGGIGSDKIFGEDGSDRLDGGDDADDLMAGDGNDRVFGGAGADKVNGDDGQDSVYGGDGRDELSGGAGRDLLDGGRGADTFELWEATASRNVVRIGKGDTGNFAGTVDTVNNFDDGVDKIDLRDFGNMRFRPGSDYAANGQASCYYVQGREQGPSFLMIDSDGNGQTDAWVEFGQWQTLDRGDILLG